MQRDALVIIRTFSHNPEIRTFHRQCQILTEKMCDQASSTKQEARQIAGKVPRAPFSSFRLPA